MNTVAIDTHKTIQKLISNGFTTEQAEGLVNALTESEIVTNTYLDKRLSELENKMIRWIVGLFIAQITIFTAIVSVVLGL